MLPNTCSDTAAPQVQGPSRGWNELCKCSHEITASSSEGKVRRHRASADQSLSFAEMCGAYAANGE